MGRVNEMMVRQLFQNMSDCYADTGRFEKMEVIQKDLLFKL